MILQAENAHAGAIRQLVAQRFMMAIVYKTENGGTLRAQLGGPQMYLRASTSTIVHGLPNGFSAELEMAL